MAITVLPGYGFVAKETQIDVPTLAWTTDFALTTEDADKSVVTNIQCPVDQPETMRWQISDVANVYNGTGIDPSVFATSKRGVSLLVQVNDIFRVADADKPGFQMDLPVSTHIVVKIPKSQYITSEMIQQVVYRNISALLGNAWGTDRLEQLVRGALTPPGL